jgi:AraC-like DNA-binding protein
MEPKLDGFEVFEVLDPTEMDERSLISGRLPGPNTAIRYTLRDGGSRGAGSQQLLTRLATRAVGDVRLSHAADRYGTKVDIVDPGMDAYCFSMLRTGRMGVITADGRETIATDEASGWVHSGDGRTRVLTEDGTTRSNIWIATHRFQAVVQACLGDRMREPLVFEPRLDWAAGAGASLARLVSHLACELQQPDGIATNQRALAAFTDLFVHTALRGLPHNYSERLLRQGDGVAPKYVRRAESYIREHAEEAISMQDLAAAAGCSVRALQLAFRRFRDTTPHAALNHMRLDLARATLARGDVAVTSVARRFGFTNGGRFTAAYARRFGERPSDTRLKV